MEPYLTVLGYGYSEQSIERSRFLGYAAPAKTASDCEEFFERIRKEHRQATHNVPAYVLGETGQLQWASDDGEPSGTSGTPIVHMLVNEGISDVCIMITRYFGGTKLGTGGLVRAYTSTAKMAVADAGLGLVFEHLELRLKLDYAAYNRLEAANGDIFTIMHTEFTDSVVTELAIEPMNKETALKQVFAAAPHAAVLSEKTEVVTIPYRQERSEYTNK